ncbi:MAG: molybdenum cofactor guanylyltransferase [Candidatus Krumholzibacteria bacterium]|nr:molybdenum cofactor guanylyltransferase [Candidatus Krumholzibacteria bacterium]
MSGTRSISCAILAGGKGKRLNDENKALLRIGERNNLENIIHIAEGIFEEILLITNRPEKYREFGNIRIHGDIILDVGPLGGMHSALANAGTEAVFFLPCDMPFLRADIIAEEIDEYFRAGCEIIVPRIGELIEPLHSIFSAGLKTRLEDHIRTAETYAIREFFRISDVHYWDLDDTEENRKTFMNINTHHDLDRARRAYARGKGWK